MNLFGRSILKPDLQREPTYDSGNPESGQFYTYPCHCGSTMQVDLASYIGHFQDRESILGPENSEAIRKHFNLRSDRSLANGWPRLRTETCCKCGDRYLVYVAVFEPANGWFKVVPQGITQLLP